MKLKCPHCRGTDSITCLRCGGTGFIEAEVVELPDPKTFTTLELIEQARKGAANNNDVMFWFFAGAVAGSDEFPQLSVAIMKAGREWDNAGALLLLDELEKRIRQKGS